MAPDNQPRAEEQPNQGENEVQGNEVILHIVKVFNDGTGVPYTSSLIKDGLNKEPLSKLRGYLVTQKVLDARLAGRRFCTKGRSEVQDTVIFATYLEMVSGGEHTAEKEGTKKDEPKAPSTTSSTAKQQVTVYITAQKSNSKTGFNPETTPKVDLSTADKTQLKDAKFLQAQSQYNASQWAARAGSGDTVHPYEMTEEDWGIVIANNALTCAYNLVTGTVKGKDNKPELHVLGAKRSLYPAFQIKARDPAPFELFHKVGVTSQKVQVHIPRLRVTDDTRVDVIETNTAFEETMAKSSFSEDSYEGSAGGGAFGFSVSVSGGHSSSQGASTVNGKSEQAHRMHVIYKFPRVELLLDEHSLEPTAECKADWAKVQGDEDAKRHFFEKYGRFIPTYVQLGGRLIATQDVDEKDGMTGTERKNTMKWSAGVSFSSPYAQASFKTTHEKQSAASDTKKHSEMSTAINWEALGGDTLLANSPPDWCPTVASFHNWRVMHQSNIIPIENLLPSSVSPGQRFRTTLKLPDGFVPRPMWMAPRFIRLPDELSQPSINSSPDVKSKYMEGVNNYSPFMGASTDPIPITIPELREDEQLEYGKPYLIKVLDGYLTIADEIPTQDKDKFLGDLSVLCIKQPPSGTAPPDLRWMFVPPDNNGNPNVDAHGPAAPGEVMLACKLPNGKYATLTMYDRADKDKRPPTDGNNVLDWRFLLLYLETGAPRIRFRLQKVEEAYQELMMH